MIICRQNQFDTFTPVFSKSGVFRATTVNEWRWAVSAIDLARDGTLMPPLFHFALSRPQTRRHRRAASGAPSVPAAVWPWEESPAALPRYFSRRRKSFLPACAIHSLSGVA